MALEYMAFVYTGEENATVSVRKYADAYLVPIDPKYGEVAELMWRSFRNGLVHGSWPQPIESVAEPGVLICVGVGNELTDEHLAPIAGVTAYAVGVSAPRLLRDLKHSFRPAFRNWILHSAPKSVLKRGGPKRLELSASDQAGNRQFRTIKQWCTDA
jgi:hypothetical protein